MPPGPPASAGRTTSRNQDHSPESAASSAGVKPMSSSAPDSSYLPCLASLDGGAQRGDAGVGHAGVEVESLGVVRREPSHGYYGQNRSGSKAAQAKACGRRRSGS
jgi:hypothetical protein